MNFFKNLGAELGTGTGRGLVALCTVAWKLFCIFVVWLVSWEHKEGISDLKINSLRIAVMSFLLACFFVPSLVTFNFSSQPTNTQHPQTVVTSTVATTPPPSPSIIEPRDEPTPNQPLHDDSHVTVKVQLGEPPFPAFPSKEHFEVEESTTIQLYHIYKGIEYYRYHRGIGDRPPTVVVAEKSSCVIVPAGKSVFIKTISPPTLAINMVDEVGFVVDEEKLPSRNIFAKLFLSAPSLVFHKDWRYLQKNWGIVNTAGNYLLLAKASTEGEIPPPYRGGLVCF